ncbi:hypothetical protein BS78_03G109100, partial [Paspalum vaginatum]
MLARLSDKLSRYACGFSPPATTMARRRDDDDKPRDWFAGFSSAFLLSPGRDEQPPCASPPLTSSSSSCVASEAPEEEPAAEDGETTLPCVAFPSQHGYMVFSLAEDSMRGDGVRLPPVIGRRLVPSPYGGPAVLATDLSSCMQPSRLVDPFTAESKPLPDLPEPEVRHQGRRPPPRTTDDGFAWDRSPSGVMVARGDTVFFCEGVGGGGGEWKPVHWPRGCSTTVTVNYRGGFFFIFEHRYLFTTVIDACTLSKVAEIRRPRGVGAVDCSHLVASTDDVLLLVHHARDMDCELFSEVYRASHKKPKPVWSKVTDIGDRALFVDRLHGFSVGINGENNAGIRRNCVYTISATPVEDPQGRRIAVYHVEEFDVKRPEVGETLKCQLGGTQVEQIWGEPFWMIP